VHLNHEDRPTSKLWTESIFHDLYKIILLCFSFFNNSDNSVNVLPVETFTKAIEYCRQQTSLLIQRYARRGFRWPSGHRRWGDGPLTTRAAFRWRVSCTTSKWIREEHRQSYCTTTAKLFIRKTYLLLTTILATSLKLIWVDMCNTRSQWIILVSLGVRFSPICMHDRVLQAITTGTHLLIVFCSRPIHYHPGQGHYHY